MEDRQRILERKVNVRVLGNLVIVVMALVLVGIQLWLGARPVISFELVDIQTPDVCPGGVLVFDTRSVSNLTGAVVFYPSLVDSESFFTITALTPSNRNTPYAVRAAGDRLETPNRRIGIPDDAVDRLAAAVESVGMDRADLEWPRPVEYRLSAQSPGKPAGYLEVPFALHHPDSAFCQEQDK